MTETPVLPPHMRRDQFDPSPELARLGAEGTVTQVAQAFFRVAPRPTWLVTGYDEIRQVLGDAGRFSNTPPWAQRAAGAPAGRTADPGRPAVPPADPGGHTSHPADGADGHPDGGVSGEATPTAQGPGMILMRDPPDHTRLRRMLTGEFTVRRMRRLQPRIEAIVTEHLDEMERAGPPADLVQSFALPVPSLVICELLGVPFQDRAAFQRRSRLRLDMSGALEERMVAGAESLEYMTALVARQRAGPGDDLLGMLVREHGAELTDQEMVGIGDLLLLAGHETTASMLGLGTALLLREPDQLALLRDDPGTADAAVEELLRYLAIVHSTVPRTARTDVVIGGQLIRAGDQVLCSLPLANRSGGLGADMDKLDLAREPVPHLAFGHGIHHCLGAPLARMEMRIAFPELLRRFPSLQLAEPGEEVPFRAFSFVYAVQSLPVTW